jgi:hypothetical protein
METSLAEFVLLGAAVALIYFLLRPVQAWIESLLLKFLNPKERGITDAEIVPDQKKKRKE